MNSFAPLAILALALCAAGCGKPEVCASGEAPAVSKLSPVADAGLHPYSHAHNDYEHDRPLFDALDARFYSVEADVFFDDGAFNVSHGGVSGSKGTLRALYLEPLRDRIAAKGGSVHGDGLPFTLWIDLKDSNKALPEKLEALLAEFDGILSRYEGGVKTPGAVDVILTGDKGGKTAFGALAKRHASRDSNDFSPEDPPADTAWTAYSLPWGSYVGWGGDGEPTAEESERLNCIVGGAHAKGRKVRFYGGPDKESVWRLWMSRGVDFLHTDKLKELEGVLDAP